MPAPPTNDAGEAPGAAVIAAYSILYRGHILFGFCFDPPIPRRGFYWFDARDDKEDDEPQELQEPQEPDEGDGGKIAQENVQPVAEEAVEEPAEDQANGRAEVVPGDDEPAQDMSYILLSNADLLRWKYASIAVLENGLAQEGFINLRKDDSDCRFDLLSLPDFLVDRAANWPTRYLDLQRFSKRHIPFWIAFWALGFFYGSIHQLAWYAPFKTSAEEILWKISGFAIIGAAPLITLHMQYIYLDQIMDSVSKVVRVWSRRLGKDGPRPRPRPRRPKTEWEKMIEKYGKILIRSEIQVLQAVSLTYIVTTGACYLAARSYLIVECFINLFYLDAHAFQVPRWTQYFISAK